MKLLTDRQLDLMEILWDHGSTTVRDALEELNEDPAENLAYTSVLTVLQTLEENGDVRHEREGKAYRWLPVTTRKEAAWAYVQFLHGHGLLYRVVKQGEEVVDQEDAAV